MILYAIMLVLITATIYASFFYHFRGRNVLLFASYTLLGIYFFCNNHYLLGTPISRNILTDYIYKDVASAKVLYFKLNPPKNILLLISAANLEHPLYLSMPWDNKVAQKLQESDGDGHGEGKGKPANLNVKKPFAGDGLETRPNDFEPVTELELRLPQKPGGAPPVSLN